MAIRQIHSYACLRIQKVKAKIQAIHRYNLGSFSSWCRQRFTFIHFQGDNPLSQNRARTDCTGKSPDGPFKLKCPKYYIKTLF